MLQWFQAADFYDIGYESWSHGMINVLISELIMLKHSSTLAVSVPLNLCIKLDFVSVNDSRNIDFVDALRKSLHSINRF